MVVATIRTEAESALQEFIDLLARDNALTGAAKKDLEEEVLEYVNDFVSARVNNQG